MAKFSMKKGGKEVGQAGVYAQPHTMKGKGVTVQSEQRQKPGSEVMKEMNIAAGNISKGTTLKLKKGGPTSLDRKKYGRNLSRAMNQRGG